MQAIRLRLPELIRIELQKFEDPRGSFMVTWERQSFAISGIHAEFVQDNYAIPSEWPTERELRLQAAHWPTNLRRMLGEFPRRGCA